MLALEPHAELTTYRRCKACAKFGGACYRPLDTGLTTCKQCARQKKPCSWTPRKPSRRPPAKSPISVTDSEQPPEFVGVIETILKEISGVRAECRRNFAAIRRELADLKTGNGKILGHIATTSLDVDGTPTLKCATNQGGVEEVPSLLRVTDTEVVDSEMEVER